MSATMLRRPRAASADAPLRRGFVAAGSMPRGSALRPARARRVRVLPGFGLALGYTHRLSVPGRADPAVGGIHQDGRAHVARVRRHRDRAARRGELPADVRRVARRGGDQRGLRTAGRLGARPLSLPRQADRRRAGRFSVRVADGRRGHRAGRAVRAQRLDGPAADAARDQGRVHAVGRAGGADVHRPAVRRAHRAAGARGTAARARGGGDHARRVAARRSSGGSSSRSSCRRC